MKITRALSLGTLMLAFVLNVPLAIYAATSVDLDSAESFAVLAGSTITNTGSSVIEGDLGLAPGTSVTGFPPGTLNGSQEINSARAIQAQTDLTSAYNDAAGQTGAVTISGDLGGRTLVAGVYNSASSLGLTGTLILDGENDANAVFVFQAGSTLTTGSGSNVSLINGAQACNVFWQVGSSATLGTNSNLSGSILALTSITLNNGASVDGRVLARNGAVTLDNNSVEVPDCDVAVVTPPATTTTVTATTTATTATSTPAVVATTTVIAIAPAVVTPIAVVAPTPALPNSGRKYGPMAAVLPIALMVLVVSGIAVYTRRKESSL